MKTIHEQMRHDHLIDLLDHTDNLLSYVDTGYIYRAVNGAYSRMYHKDSGEIIGHHVSDILGLEAFETIVKPNLDRAFLGETLQYESWFDFPGLPRCYLIVTYNPRYHKDGTVEGVVVSAVDYTSLKIMEVEKQKQDEIVLEISKMAQIGEMISFISHQWRRPLNTISTYLLKIRRLIGSNDPATEAIQRCETLLDRLSSDLESMYALYARNSASEETDVQKSVEHVIALVFDRSKGLDIHIGIDIPEPLCVKCHTDELMHILLVIVENAIDSIAQANGPIKYIRIDAHKVDNHVMIDIKNNGDAISVEYSQRLFEPGFTTKPLSGQGYGLYFARKIVTEKLGGRIEIQPIQDGSWFRVTLPSCH